MATTEPAYGAWKESFLKADEEAARAPQSIDEMGAELKGLCALALIGLGFLIASAFFSAFTLNYVVNGEKTTGVVVDFRRSFHHRHGESFSPIVAYVANGEEYCVDNAIGTGTRTYRLHQEVPVLYLRNDPGQATIADFLQLYLFPTIFGGLGLACVTVSGGLTAYLVRKSGWRFLPRLAAKR
jgi:hypothetical protein